MLIQNAQTAAIQPDSTDTAFVIERLKLSTVNLTALKILQENIGIKLMEK